MAQGKIHVGVGGWTYEPWRGGAFYPQNKTVTQHKKSILNPGKWAFQGLGLGIGSFIASPVGSARCG